MRYSLPGYSKYYMDKNGDIYNLKGRKIKVNKKNMIHLINDDGKLVTIPVNTLQYDIFGIRFFIDDDEFVYKVKGFPEILLTSKNKVFLLRIKRLIPKRKHAPKEAYSFRDQDGNVRTISIKTLVENKYISEWENIK